MSGEGESLHVASTEGLVEAQQLIFLPTVFGFFWLMPSLFFFLAQKVHQERLNPPWMGSSSRTLSPKA